MVASPNIPPLRHMSNPETFRSTQPRATSLRDTKSDSQATIRADDDDDHRRRGIGGLSDLSTLTDLSKDDIVPTA